MGHRMARKHYTPEDLEKLLECIKKDVPILELEAKIGRSAWALLDKIKNLQELNIGWKIPEVYSYKKKLAKYYYITKGKEYETKNKERLLEERQERYKKNIEVHRKNQKKYNKRYKKKWKIFGDYLSGLIGAHREYCGESEIRQDVAKELGLTPSYLSHLIHGNRRPTEEILEIISEKYKVPIETLKEKAKLQKRQR